MKQRTVGFNSTYKGVSKGKIGGTWRARIGGRGSQRQIGTYGSEVEAALAYDEAARIEFGVKARLNFPKSGELGVSNVVDIDDTMGYISFNYYNNGSLIACKIDLIDKDLLSDHVWFLDSWMYLRTKTGGLMHRMIIIPDEGYQIDHINLDRYDNRRSNLRIVTNSQNARNKPIRKDNKYGFKGVEPSGSKWVARCRINGKCHYSKSFETIIEAAMAYNAMAIELHGEFASLNHIGVDHG